MEDPPLPNLLNPLTRLSTKTGTFAVDISIIKCMVLNTVAGTWIEDNGNALH